MKLKPYPEYKESGVEWLGKSPEHWEVRRLSYFFSERREKVSDKDYQALSVTKNGVVPQLENAAKTDDGDNRKLVLAGDFVINSRSDRKGSSGLSDLDGSVSLINTVLKPYSNIHGRFAHHLFRSYLFQEEYYKYGRGIVADLWSTNYSEMRNISLAVPSYDDQISIATFLNHETAKLDTLIAKQEKLIELLQEKRQAIISHAVTKGLDPNVKMKDSGVEWLGMVPEHWDATKIKYIAKLNPKIPDWVRNSEGLICNFLPMDKIGDDGTCILETEKAVDEVINGYTFFENDDVCYAKVTPCFENGKGTMFSGLKNGIGFGTTEITIFRPTNLILPEFLYFIFHSDYFKSIGMASMTGAGGLKRVPDNIVNNLVVAIPNINEQIKLLSQLKKIVKVVDDLTDKTKLSIELAKEHRTALISAAVTGKIDVREYEQ